MTLIARPAGGLFRSFTSLGTGAQLATAFGVVLLLTAAVGAVGLFGLHRVAGQADELSRKWLPGIEQLASAKAALVDAREYEIKHSRSGDKSYHAEYEAKMADAAKALSGALDVYGKHAAGDDAQDERKLLADANQRWADYQKSQQRVIALGRQGKQRDAADISDGASSAAADEMVGAIDKLWKFNVDGGERSAQAAEATYVMARSLVAGLVAAALLIGAVLATLFTRSLLRRLGGEPTRAAEVARAVAGGDLSTPIPVRAGDSASLMAQLQAMQNSLATAVREVRAGSENVATASAQIAQGNVDLSQRTEEQAGALQKTASTMEQLGATVRNNADNARQANQLAQGASQVAQRGGDVVGQVVQTMKGIQDASRKIGDIISVIDGIAFQTNILALNAAVEAARAGEQGRGFAVVAAEVRSLAQRSAEAAKEIKGLIGTSVERVEQGTALVDQAGNTMQDVVRSIQRVTDIVGEISSASSEQSAGVSQIGRAVAEMDQATQRNAALVEESAAAAESLKQQATQLLQSVAVFKLGGDADQRIAATPAPMASAPPPAPTPVRVERRGPNRATNVTRPDFKTPRAAEPAKTGTDDGWESF